MHPFSEEELEAFWEAATTRNERLANILLVAGWTGLRWSELRALRVRDFVEVPMPLLVVERAEPEGVRVKVTKSGRGRRVPVADRILPIVQELAQAKSSDSLLFVTQSGHQLHASAVKRTIGWTSLSRGSPHSRPSPHRRLPMAREGCRSRDRSELDGTCLDRHDEHLPAPSRDRSRPNRTRPPEQSGEHMGHTFRQDQA